MINNETKLDSFVVHKMNQYIFFRLRLLPIVFINIFMILIIIAASFLDKSLLTLCYVCGGIVLVCDVIVVAAYFVGKKKQKQIVDNNFVYKYDFDADGFDVEMTSNTQQAKARVPYSAIKKSYETKDLFLLAQNDISVFVVDKRNMVETDIIMLRSIISNKTKSKMLKKSNKDKNTK